MNKIEQFAEFLRSKPKPNGEKYSEKYVMEVCGLAKRLPNPITVGNVNQFLKEKQWHPPACRAVSTFMQWYLYGNIGKEIRDKMKEKKQKMYVSPKRPLKKSLRERILSFEEIKKLFSEAPTIEDKLILEMLYFTASRRGDNEEGLLSMTIEKTNLKEMETVIKVKGGEYFKLYWDEQTNEDLIKYIKENNIKKGRIFKKFNGYRLWYKIKKLCKDILGKDVTTHDFRRTALTHMAIRDANPFMIKEKAGHKDIKTTMQYVYLAQEKAKEATKKYLSREN